MLLDNLDQVMSSFAPTTGASLQNYIDRIKLMEDGAGQLFEMYVNVAAAVTSAGAATVQFQAVGNATDVTFASGNVILADSGAIAKATLVAGYQIHLPLGPAAQYKSLELKSSFLRYVTILVTVGTADLTAGTFNGWITTTFGIQNNLSYPAGYTV